MIPGVEEFRHIGETTREQSQIVYQLRAELCDFVHTLAKCEEKGDASGYSSWKRRALRGLVRPGLPRWLSGKEPACQRTNLSFNPWIGKIPWKTKSSVLAQRIPGAEEPGGYSPWGHRARQEHEGTELGGGQPCGGESLEGGS